MSGGAREGAGARGEGLTRPSLSLSRSSNSIVIRFVAWAGLSTSGIPPPATASDHSRLPESNLAVGKTVILLHPSPPLVGAPIGMEKGCQQNDSLADG